MRFQPASPALRSYLSHLTTHIHHTRPSSRIPFHLSVSATRTTTQLPSHRHFTSTTAKMSGTFFDAVKSRRTIYQLSDESVIPDSKIKEIVEQAVLHVPSSFNSQSTRVLVVLGDEHKKLWNEIVKPAVKAVAPAEAWPSSEQRLSGFAAGYGTVLFYEDPADVHALQQKFALYADKFPQWSEHTNAMHQYAVWTALEVEGFGANLQHYNPLIDEKIAATWNIPQVWSLKGQLVFGKPAGKAGEKSFKPLEERVFIHGAKN
ncbi:Nitroreductase-like protein [Exophiala viscosa]|uniref:Nitroreductase-like protein n=1 Tax=Exophiala viscosa TaxID=2486360 RepID=A0AAN6DLG4_9EURO|nr:Nitroreductase-like protein [Exophiala viscosa]KAI1620317.1 Nitroreductase-like protein [Exophiala viscosa]